MILSSYKIAANIPQDFKFIFASDIHNADIVPIVRAIKESDVDAVLVPGDFIHDSENYKNGLSFLKQAASCKPTFCSLGNHERKFEGELLPLVKETGAVLLDNASVMFHDICIGGFSSGYDWCEAQANTKKTPEPDLEWLKRFAETDGYKILLSHHPEYYKPYIASLPIDLTLSGHAHGGQWRIFKQGIFAPGQGFFPKYTSGLYDGKLLVGRGLGDSHAFPPRIFNKTELLFVHLIAKK